MVTTTQPPGQATVVSFDVAHIAKRAAEWWRSGFDTLQIARAMNVPEALVWNHLSLIKAAAKGGA